ncbi:MAG: lactonase family protein, partial [Lachnospiraceae bacterium]|nr:lactonase family protein [Lachnospiraceae bacterium]
MCRKGQTCLFSGYSGNSTDIVLSRLSENGAISVCSSLRTGKNPSCLCAGAQTGVFYAGCEQPNRAEILCLRVEKDKLWLGKKYEIPGTGLCHILYTSKGLFGCCYGSGDVFLMDFLGHVLWHVGQQQGGHAHWGELTPDGKFFTWVDLGMDCIFFCALKNGVPCGAPWSVRLPKGSGPRQILFLKHEYAAVVLETMSKIALLHRTGSRWEIVDFVSCTG